MKRRTRRVYIRFTIQGRWKVKSVRNPISSIWICKWGWYHCAHISGLGLVLLRTQMSNFIGGNRSDPSEVELQRQQTDRQKYGLQTEWGRGRQISERIWVWSDSQYLQIILPKCVFNIGFDTSYKWATTRPWVDTLSYNGWSRKGKLDGWIGGWGEPLGSI